MTKSATMFRDDHIFHTLAQLRARAVLDRLDDEFRVDVRLVGFRSQPSGLDPHPAEVLVVPPESELTPSDFGGLGAREAAAEAAEVVHPLQRLQTFVREVLGAVDARDRRRSYCGTPVVFGDDETELIVIPVVRVDSAAAGRHEPLGRDTFPVSEVSRARIATSLLDAAILELLGLFDDTLRNPRPLSKEVGRFRPEEVLHRAAVRLMHTPEAAADVAALEQLSAACDRIAVMKYEGREARGRLIIGARDHPAIETLLTFDPPVRISSHRTVRKLLEISSPRGPGLVTDGEFVRGLGSVGAGYDRQAEDCFAVDFLANGLWELSHNEQSLMIVRYGQPELPRPAVGQDRIRDELRALDADATDDAAAAIWAVIDAAATAGHGALVVVSRTAEGEVTRLHPQVLSVSPVPLTRDLVVRTTSIDGALLLGTDARCYAIGAILDGSAAGKGDPSRGSRYNSAVRYVSSQANACFVVVVSEDGMVDVIAAGQSLPRIHDAGVPQ